MDGSTRSESAARTALARLSGVTKEFQTASGTFAALRDVDLDIHEREILAIVGRSGSGKTTLAHLLTGIDRATRGSVVVGGAALAKMNEAQLAAWRGEAVGVVFQFFQLLPTLTIVENVMLPMELARRGTGRARRERALSLLERVGVRDQAEKLPATLSGGQQQRAAIARALANDPPLLVADEPTGNLDQRTSLDVWQLFERLRDDGKTVVVVTHEPDLTRRATRMITIADGRIVAEPAERRHHA